MSEISNNFSVAIPLYAPATPWHATVAEGGKSLSSLFVHSLISSAILEEDKTSTLFEIILHQGLNRQIRKMFEFLGYNVINLKRIRHANIELTGLKKGQIKQIKPRQIKELKAYLEKIKEEK